MEGKCKEASSPPRIPLNENTKPFVNEKEEQQMTCNKQKSLLTHSSPSKHILKTPPSVIAILAPDSLDTPVRPDFLKKPSWKDKKPIPFSLKIEDEKKTTSKTSQINLNKSKTSTTRTHSNSTHSNVRKKFPPPQRIPRTDYSEHDDNFPADNHVFTQPKHVKVHKTPQVTAATPQIVQPKHDVVEEFKSKQKYLIINNKPYLICKVLGEGGSSKVYQALDMDGNIKAIKEVMLRGLEREIRDSFIREVKFLQEFKNSPYIIHLHEYEYRERDVSLFMVLEFGSTDILSIMKKNTLEPNEVLVYWKSMLRAINAVHEKDIIHQDIKPANFVLVNGRIKLIDFGIANKISSDATSMLKDNQFGTYNYMAPEALLDKSAAEDENPQYKVGRKADTWSAGCLLYLMMYGRTPFQHITKLHHKINAITNDSHKIEFKQYPNDFLTRIVKLCLSREPKLRPTIESLLQSYP